MPTMSETIKQCLLVYPGLFEQYFLTPRIFFLGLWFVHGIQKKYFEQI